MQTRNVLGGLLCLSLVAGCGGRDDDGEEREARHGLPPSAETADGVAQAVTATGCLTQAGDRFVLTELERGGSGTPTTEAYQLVNLEDQLRQYVGKEVRVYGQADTPKAAEVRELTPAATSGQAQVNTETRTRLETSTLRISSVAVTGNACDVQR